MVFIIVRSFDFIFNLFTSFGYFQNQADNLRCLKAFEKGLNKNGVLLIDFMNAHKTMETLIPHEIKRIDNFEFEIN